MAYGGAGPLHATAIADELGMVTVLVPPMPANFSAFGLLVADLRREFARTYVAATAELPEKNARAVLDELLADGRRELDAAGFPPDKKRFEVRLDMRYIGQAFELSVAIPIDFTSMDEIDVAFREVYADRYGDAPDGGTEIVNFRLTAWGITDKPSLPELNTTGRARDGAHVGVRNVVFDERVTTTDIYRRSALPLNESIEGPALIEESSSVTVVPPDWLARLTANDCIVLERKP